MHSTDVFFRIVTTEEEVDRLGLADVRLTLCSQREDDVLVDFESGFEHSFVVLVQPVYVLNAAVVVGNVHQRVAIVHAFFLHDGE